MTKVRVYVAGSRDIAGQADRLADFLRSDEVEITSKWHVNETKLVDPSDGDVRRKILRSNLEDLEKADFVVALMTSGKPKATYAEIGYALAEGKPVVWIGPVESEDPLACIFDAHDNVVRVDTFEKARDGVRAYAARERAPDGSITSARVAITAKRLAEFVGEKTARIVEGMGGDQFAKDQRTVGSLMAQASHALSKKNQPLLEWFSVATDMLAIAMLSGAAARNEEKPKINDQNVN